MKVLLLSPYVFYHPGKPLAVAVFNDICLKHGIDTIFFDTAIYAPGTPYNNLGDMNSNFKKSLKDIDIVLITVMEISWKLTQEFLNIIKSYNKDIITILGGPFAYNDWKIILDNNKVDYVGVYEGELIVDNIDLNLYLARSKNYDFLKEYLLDGIVTFQNT